MNQRTDAWCLLTEYTQSESLRKHALAVEACMRAYARKNGGDEELWGLVGLLHDFDYEKYPTATEHPYKGYEILKECGYSEEVRRALPRRLRRSAWQLGKAQAPPAGQQQGWCCSLLIYD
jgi:putative nucleotidyltransferase with HDIG domain